MTTPIPQCCGSCAAKRPNPSDTKGVTVICALNPPTVMFLGMQEATAAVLKAGQPAPVHAIIRNVRPVMFKTDDCQQWQSDGAH